MPFNIKVDKSGLACKVSWETNADHNEKPSKEDLINSIKLRAIKDIGPEIIDEAFDTLISEGKLEDFLLIKGTSPTPPKDGMVKWFFDLTLENIHAGKLTKKDGSIDY